MSVSHVAPSHAALIVVDVQPDFMPGGPLACHQGDAIVPGLQRLLASRRFGHVVATQDWHPREHVSFVDAHPGRQPFEQIELHGRPQTLWPVHCVQNTPGAALHPAIDWSVAQLILRKGCDAGVDSYSAFRENHGAHGERAPTGLAGWLRERGVTAIEVCGLARDVCVLWTAQDARALGFDIGVRWDLCCPVTPDTDAATRRSLQEQGIRIVRDEMG